MADNNFDLRMGATIIAGNETQTKQVPGESDQCGSDAGVFYAKGATKE